MPTFQTLSEYHIYTLICEARPQVISHLLSSFCASAAPDANPLMAQDNKDTIVITNIESNTIVLLTHFVIVGILPLLLHLNPIFL